MPITLRSALTLKNAFAFPVQSSIARREVLIGAAWLLVPIVGWLLNMGHRIRMVHRMQHARPAWPAWTSSDDPNARLFKGTDSLFRHGLITFAGMLLYHAPAAILFAVARWGELPWLTPPAILLWIAATCLVPGYMTAYCLHYDWREVFNPIRAIRRVINAGPGYWHAWAIALAALACSFLGLFAFGIGFLITSVWFWQTAGFAFATTFTQQRNPQNPASGPTHPPKSDP